jgi:DNA replication protein DnaC
MAAKDASATLTVWEQATCPICKGIGYYVMDVPIDSPQFGVLMICPCKQQEKDERIATEVRRLSNIGDFEGKTFENFDPHVRGVGEAYTYAREYAIHMQGWLVLFGNYGCGKTHLAAAIANTALSRHFRVLFANVPDLLDHLRSTFGPDSDVGYDVRFEAIREIPLLILDDLGTENTTPWAREKLYQIINHRYNRKLPTVITSNRDPVALEPRIFSRMFDKQLSRPFMIKAEDYRLSEENRQRLSGTNPTALKYKRTTWDGTG